MDDQLLRRIAANRTLGRAALGGVDAEAAAAVQAALVASRRESLSGAASGAAPEIQRALMGLDDRSLAADDLTPILRGLLTRAGVGEDAQAQFLETVPGRVLANRSDQPLALDPEMRQRLDALAVRDLAAAAALTPSGAAALANRVRSLAAIDDAALAELTANGNLSEAEASAVGLQAAFYHLAGGNEAAARTIAATPFAASGGKLTSVRDLLRINVAAITRTLAATGITDADGRTPDAIAAEMLARAAERFPGEAIQRISAPNIRLQRWLGQIAPLLRGDADVMSLDAAAVEIEAIPAEQRPFVAEALAQVQAMVRRFPGYDLQAEIREGGDPAETFRLIGARVAALEAIGRGDGEVEPVALDFAPGGDGEAVLDAAGLSGADRARALTTLKARQRVFAVAPVAADTAALMGAGYHSALAIAREDPDTLQRRTGLSRETVIMTIDRARDVTAGVSVTVGSIIDATRGGFNRLPVGNLFEDVSDGLSRVPGYAELFGEAGACDCSHCQSILSPAAYFVDLMQFVEESVTGKDFIKAKANHALNLKVRRPDLWTLPLTCANTETLVPMLDIVNETLETYLAKRHAPAIDLTDRTAIETLIYGHVLPEETRSFVTPFLHAEEQAQAYLAPFGETRAALFRAAGVTGARAAAVTLGLSPAAYDLVVTPRADLGYLGDLFRTEFKPVGSGLAAVDMADLLAGSGFGRDDLGAMIGAAAVAGADTPAIKPQKRSAESVQNDVERVTGFTIGVLDRLHRFARLWRRLGWSVAELDLVLRQRPHAGAPVIDAAALDDVAATVVLQQRFGIGVEEALALWSGVPRDAVTPAGPSLFDRRFNSRPYAPVDGLLPKDQTRFVHPAFRTSATPIPADNTLPRLLFALQLDEAGFAALIRLLAPALGADLNAADETLRGFALSWDNLSLLYRHARLAALLRRSADELAQLIALAGISGAVRTRGELERLLALDDRLRAWGLAVAELRFAHGEDGTQAVAGQAAAIVAAVAQDGALDFADTVFAFVPRVTEELSRAIVALNAELFERRPLDLLRLKPSVPAAPVLALPPGVDLPAEALIEVLAGHHAARVLAAELAARLSIAPDRLTAMLALAQIDLGAPELALALQGGDETPLGAVVLALSRLAAALPEILDADRIAFVSEHRAMFDWSGPVPTLATLERLFDYAMLLTPVRSTAIVPDPAAVDAALAAYSAGTRFAAVGADGLARALGSSPGGLEMRPELPAHPIEALARIAALVRRSAASGIGADTVALLLSDDPATLGRGAEGLVSALRRRHTDDAAFAAVMEPLEDRMRAARRDALVDHAIRSGEGRFAGPEDLYAYFLIDPQYEPCARTSRVVAATASLQTYVNRVLLNLEQDRRDSDAANHVHVLPSRIDRTEWSWRNAYRVWEANRKVFLWPENYIEPELRDDRTPLFRALEQALLQKDLTEQNVLDAYGDYMAGFEQMAGLKIAGAYHDRSDAVDVLHLFGCSLDDPAVYYYWTASNLYLSRSSPDRLVSFSARQRIEVAVPGRSVSPIIHDGRMHLFWNEIATGPRNSVTNGQSNFIGYRHRITTKFATLRLDGSWSVPQPIAMRGNERVLPGLAVNDRLMTTPGYVGVPQRSVGNQPHSEPRDDYTLRGFQWERVFPASAGDVLLLNAGGLLTLFQTDLFDRDQADISLAIGLTLVNAWENGPLLHIGADRGLYLPTPDLDWWLAIAPPSARQAMVADRLTFDQLISQQFKGVTSQNYPAKTRLDPGSLGPRVAQFATPDVTALAVPGAPGDAGLIVQSARDSAYVIADGGTVRAWRLGTTLARDLSRILFTGGIETLLATETQASLREDAQLVRPSTDPKAAAPTPADFNGAMGVYLREIFFHAPFLIADHLNSRQKFAAAQMWYHYVFNPTAPPDPTPAPETLSEKQVDQAMRDRVWRYLPFRGQTLPSLRDILTDDQAIEAYRRDPFNPHAIARLRISAYQQSVVMKYVANLIDWGDSLFLAFTTESVNEAVLLYTMAEAILGPKPPAVGECGEGSVRPKTYQAVASAMDAGSEFLTEVETQFWTGARATRRPGRPAASGSPKRRIEYRRDPDELAGRRVLEGWTLAGGNRPRMAVTGMPLPADPALATFLQPEAFRVPASPVAGAAVTAAARRVAEPVAEARPGTGAFSADWRTTRAGGWTVGRFGPTAATLNTRPSQRGFGGAGFAWSVVRQLGPAFCVPANPALADLRARVEDRLFKIRHCLDITGARRDLALFAPEIDPALLVRARAAGLSLEDVTSPASGDLPPYRFTYLIERARQQAASVQAFGAALLAAMEKHDGEELVRLRNTQAANALALTTRMREWDVKLAEEGVTQATMQRDAAIFRRDYYSHLIDTDLLSWERAQEELRQSATVAFVAGSALTGTAGVLHLIPQLGSPFALKYGGKESGDSAKAFGAALVDTAKQLEALGALAGLEASFQRRREGWDHQLKLAERDVAAAERQVLAAGIRRDAARRGLELHQSAIADQEEIAAFFADKFTNAQLYTWHVAALQRIYRQSFNGALATARLAERAFRFERGDETSVLLSPSYWSAERAGLLAGEQLAADLSDLDRRFFETNYRTLEIDQSFSMSQLAPAQLMALRQTGQCDLVIPELALDVFYPGHYRRRIRAARLTIMCVTGPYANIAATLTLKRSWVRRDAKPGEEHLAETPMRHSTTVATSTAQADAGVFDFSFRDERYMPFEGAGVVSEWSIALPRSFRSFDYTTITDVILGVSYTSLLDEEFRASAEAENAELEGSILHALSIEPLGRAISLRNDQSTIFHRLVNSPPGTPVPFEIDERVLPYYLRGRPMTLKRAVLLIRPGEGVSGTGAAFSLDGGAVGSFAASAGVPGYLEADVAALLAGGVIGQHVLRIDQPGDLAPADASDQTIAACDPDRLRDVVLYFELVT